MVSTRWRSLNLDTLPHQRRFAALIRAVSKPDAQFTGSRLGAVGAVHEVLLDLESPVAAEIAADGSGRRGGRVGGAGQRAEALDDAVASQADRHGRAGHHELQQRFVKGLALVLGVVRRETVAVGLDQADVDERVALRLDAGEDVAGQSAGDAVRLDEDECFFSGHVIRSLCVARWWWRRGASDRSGPPRWSHMPTSRRKSGLPGRW